MLGNIVNSIALIIGGLLGVVVKNGINDRYKDTIITALGLSVIVMGLSSAIKGNNVLLLLISLIGGSLIGEIIDIEHKLDNLGQKVTDLTKTADSDFSRGFITTTLICCVGAMGIVGALEAGLNKDNSVLYVKAVLDGVTAFIFGSNFGIGVIFAAFPVLIYQGAITLLSVYLKDFFTPEMIVELSAVGGVLIMAIGYNLLDIKQIKIANMLPAILGPILYYIILMYI